MAKTCLELSDAWRFAALKLMRELPLLREQATAEAEEAPAEAAGPGSVVGGTRERRQDPGCDATNCQGGRDASCPSAAIQAKGFGAGGSARGDMSRVELRLSWSGRCQR